MSDNNGWPDPARPGVPPSEGFWWLLLPLDVEAIRYFNGEIWRIGGQLADPKDFAKYTLIGPVLTPAEVDARLSEARRVALGECISICNAVAHANRVEYPAKWKDRPEGIPHDWQQAWETCAETAEDIAAAIRALGEKE